MLERTRILNEAVRLLKGATAAGQRVYPARVSANDAKKLPAINVYTTNDRGTGKADAGGPPTFKMVTTLVVECEVAEADGWQIAADNLAEQVETRLLANANFIKEFEAVPAYNTAVGLKDGGEKPHCRAVIAIDLQYTVVIEPEVQDSLGRVVATVDAIEPADKNTHPTGGPDGRAEGVVDVRFDGYQPPET